MSELLSLLLIVSVVLAIRARKKKKAQILQKLNGSLMQQAEERRKAQLEKEQAQVIASVKSAILSSITVSSSNFREDKSQSTAESIAQSQNCWMPPGQPVEVAGYTLPDGMVYVGTTLRATSGIGPDAALIDPTKSIDRVQVDREGRSMSYWPSYSQIAPENRSAYLEWLAGGRCDPDAYIGYVFLFFYGIERRLLHDFTFDPLVKGEIPDLLKEVGRLIDVYGARSASFAGYANGLLDAVNLAIGTDGYIPTSPFINQVGAGYPLHFRLAVGKIVNDGLPLPADLALDWVRLNPEHHFRTAALRCAQEFDALFKHRYAQAFPGGLLIKTTPTRLSGRHRPASPSLSEVALTLPDLPDVTRLKTPVTKIMGLVDPVQESIVQYSRQIGQGCDRTSIPALATLPKEIQVINLTGNAKAVVEIVEDSLAVSEVGLISSIDLVALYPCKTPGKLTKTEAMFIVEFLAKRGYGVEPDIRFGGTNLSNTTHCAVFRLNESDIEPSVTFRAATVLLHLGVLMVRADGDVTVEEQKQLELHLEQALHLNPDEKKRLSAHLQWLMVDPPTATAAKSRIQELDESQRRTLGQFLISIAGADGHISPSEIKILSKIYPLLGLDPDSVYSDVHSLSVGDTGPVTVLRPEGLDKGFSIPQQPSQGAAKNNGPITLDAERIARIRESSLEASSLLSSVFAEQPIDTDNVSNDDPGTDEAVAIAGAIAGLDAQHSTFIQILSERDSWSRSDIDELAKRHDLLPAGAIEAINEASFDLCGEPLLEGDDPVEVNQFAMVEILK